MIFSPDGSIRLLFIDVPEAKTGQEPDPSRPRPYGPHPGRGGRARAAMGATVVDDQRKPDGTGWVVLADPEGTSCASCAAARSVRLRHS